MARQFLVDMRDRLVKYGPRTRLSAKQWAKLHELVGPAPPSPYAPSQTRKPPPSPYWRHRRRRGPLAREARYLTSRFVRTFGFALALVIGSLIYSYFVKGGHVTLPSMPSFARWGAGERVPLARTQFSITDGDTIRLDGAAKGTRLVGFNAPQKHRAEVLR